MKILKFIISIIFSNLYRLLRIFPNNDPIMGIMLPFAKQEKWYYGFLFAIITMASFDIITRKVGIWTLVTSLTYGALGILFYFTYRIMAKKGITIYRKVYFISGIVGVLIFDFITGPIMSSFIFNMSFSAAFIGQIPFTLRHLFSVSFFTLVLSPILDEHIISSKLLEDVVVLKKLKLLARDYLWKPKNL